MKRPIESGLETLPVLRTWQVGHLTHIDEDGRLYALLEPGFGNPEPVSLLAQLSRAALLQGIAAGSQALFWMDPSQPEPVFVDFIVRQVPSSPEAPRAEPVAAPARVRVSASEEVLIECGGASLHLRSDGNIRLRGTDISSRARGVNRIRGAAIKLN